MPNHDAPSSSSPPAVALEGVWFAYGGATVLEDVSFSIAQGESICMVGPNGGGKTTLLKLILGLLTPDRGTIDVLGQPPRGARRRIGYMPQHLGFDPQFPMTVLDIVLMGRLGRPGLRGALGWYDAADRRAALESLEAVGLGRLAHRSFASLSGGQRQRALVARALATQPDLLLLDEPTANIDVMAEAQLTDILRRLGRRLTILMVSHDLGLVGELAEKVICVNRRVVIHPTSELTGQVLESLYGHELRIVRHDGWIAPGETSRREGAADA